MKLKEVCRYSVLIPVLASAVLLLSSCGGGSNTTDGGTNVVSVQIDPGAVLLTGQGEVTALSATAFDASGATFAVSTVTWASNKPTDVEVDANGKLTSHVATGSALSTATVEGVSSDPLLVVVAQPVAGAVLIDDSQVIGDISLQNSSQPLTVGSLYDVTLTNITPPAIGDILLGTGDAPVGGRVTAVQVNGNEVTVTLENIPFDQLFTDLAINESFQLSLEDMVISDNVSDTYNLVRNTDGSISFEPKSPGVLAEGMSQADTAPGPLAATGTSAIFRRGPFECSTSLQAMPISLASTPLTRILPTSLTYTLDAGLSHFNASLRGGVTIKNTTIWSVDAGFEGKITCGAEFARINLPVTGILSRVLGAWVPFGVGAEISGKVETSGYSVETVGSFSGDLTAEMACSTSQGCQSTLDYNDSSSFETNWSSTGSTSPTNMMRFSPGLTGYGYAKLVVGINPRIRSFFNTPHLINISTESEIIEAKLGLSAGYSLTTVGGQIEDPLFAGEYKLTGDASIGMGSTVNNVLGYFDLSYLGQPLAYTPALYESPKATSMTADVSAFALNDPVNFQVKLDPNTVNYLGTYNVKKINIYKSKVDSSGAVYGDLVASSTPSSTGQTDFDISWTADQSGTIDGKFYAFVKTRGLPLPYLEELELGGVTGKADLKLLFANLDQPRLYLKGFANSLVENVNPTLPPYTDHDPVSTIGDFLYDPTGKQIVGGGEFFSGGRTASYTSSVSAANGSTSMTTSISTGTDGKSATLQFTGVASHSGYMGSATSLFRTFNYPDNNYTDSVRSNPMNPRMLIEIENRATGDKTLEFTWDCSGSLQINLATPYDNTNNARWALQLGGQLFSDTGSVIPNTRVGIYCAENKPFGNTGTQTITVPPGHYYFDTNLTAETNAHSEFGSAWAELTNAEVHILLR